MSKRKGAKIKFKLNYFINAHAAITPQGIPVKQKPKSNMFATNNHYYIDYVLAGTGLTISSHGAS
jgi:cytochrome oxidase assembly protein ShyY1